MDATIRRLARFASEAHFSALPSVAVHECRRKLIDSVGCAAAAYPERLCAQICSFASRYSGKPAARIWGSGQSTSAEMAAFANGTMLRYLDYSDTWLGRSSGHPSDMLGALVAVAEAFDCDGESLVVATAVAYEIYCGLCDAVALQSHGIDQGTCAAVGAAGGVGRMLGLGADVLAHALSLALASNLHLFNVRCGTLSDWKGCAGPKGASDGVFAANLAAVGITGPDAVVEGRGGLWEVLGPFDWTVGETAMPRIVGSHLKLHPVCYHGQSAIDATLALRDKVVLDDITNIEVETYDASYRVMGSDAGRWAPTTRETADHSLPYTIAVALQEGRLVSQAYSDERLRETATKRLMDMVSVRSSAQMTAEFPVRAQSRVTIRARDGSFFSHLQVDPKGHAANPLTDAELEKKYLELYAPFGSESSARRTLDILWAVDRMPHVSLLVDSICRQP